MLTQIFLDSNFSMWSRFFLIPIFLFKFFWTKIFRTKNFFWPKNQFKLKSISDQFFYQIIFDPQSFLGPKWFFVTKFDFIPALIVLWCNTDKNECENGVWLLCWSNLFSFIFTETSAEVGCCNPLSVMVQFIMAD